MSDNQREVEELEAETHRQRIRTESQTRAIEARGLSIQKAHEQMEGVDRVRKAGWLPAPITPVPDLKGPLFCSPHIKKAHADPKVSKLDVLMALLKPKDGWIDAMEANMQKHGRPARRQRPSHLEFWATIALFLCSHLRTGKAGGEVAAELDTPEKRLRSVIPSSDRRSNLFGALCLDEPKFRDLFANLSTRFAENIQSGSLFVVDESILGSNSKQAFREGQLKYIKGKPHPKGYFFVGGLQCFSFTKLSYIIDCEWKWSFNAPGMGDALLLIVQRAEKLLGQPLIVLADSGYPASRLLNDPHPFQSTFVASTSTAKVAGELRMLPEALGPVAKAGVPYLFHHPQHQLIAYLEKKPKYTQCLITNSVYYEDKIKTKPKMSYAQALVLALNFSAAELQANFNWPSPSSRTVAANPYLYVSECTGVDLKAPGDSSGEINEASLKKLGVPALKALHENLNLGKSIGMKKGDFITAILKTHPLALRTQSDQDEFLSDGENDEESPPRQPKNSKKRPLTRLEEKSIEQFMLPAKKPKFTDVYAEHYGLQDRMNSILYATFNVSSRAEPEAKAFWTAICLTLYNSYTLWAEQRVMTVQTVQQRMRVAQSNPTPARFFLELANELADFCQNLHENPEQLPSRRTSMASMTSQD